ncbi:MAG: biotin--[acetyl-CoA-carboxylase] ligase [SAR324 cluster bacterium]|nr:biotin--[acetyl-CoA-carboxylase] ligase [SAR324 cluster bacterium]
MKAESVNNFKEFYLTDLGTFIPHKVRYFTELNSTNHALKTHLADKQPPLIFLSDYQHQGKGRMDRVWQSPPRSGLLVSIPLITPQDLPADSPLSIYIGWAVHQALCEFGVSNLKIKWPNDLIVATKKNEKKIAGILCERSWCVSKLDKPSSPQTIVVGIGINIKKESFPANIADKVTSIEDITGEIVDNIALLKVVHKYLADLIQKLANEKEAFIWQEWQKYSLNDKWKKLAPIYTNRLY